MNLNKHESSLPFIINAENNVEVLIDTGILLNFFKNV